MTEVTNNKPSIIITAYNEQSNISKILNSLGSGKSDAFDIFVVCNGCTDNTVRIIDESFPLVTVKVLSQASKALAIRHAESFNPGYPRVYLDADIMISKSHIQTMIEQAQSCQQAKLFTPSSIINTKSSSLLVKAYYQAWYSTPFVTKQGYGSGTYTLNKEGRKRFGQWPDLTADDGFLRSVFSTDDIVVISNTIVTVQAPRSLSSLIKVKIRSKYGNLELKKYLADNRIKSAIGIRNKRLSTPFLQKIVYISINTIALLGAHLNMLLGNSKWYRDDSSR